MKSLQKSKWIKTRLTEFKIEQLKGIITVCSHLQGNAEIFFFTLRLCKGLEGLQNNSSVSVCILYRKVELYL